MTGTRCGLRRWQSLPGSLRVALHHPARLSGLTGDDIWKPFFQPDVCVDKGCDSTTNSDCCGIRMIRRSRYSSSIPPFVAASTRQITLKVTLNPRRHASDTVSFRRPQSLSEVGVVLRWRNVRKTVFHSKPLTINEWRCFYLSRSREMFFLQEPASSA